MPETADPYRGYVAHMRHPHMPSEYTRPLCELCGHAAVNPLHKKPYAKPHEEPRLSARDRKEQPAELPPPVARKVKRNRCAVCQKSSGKNLMCDPCRRSYDGWRNSRLNDGTSLSLIRWSARRARAVRT